MDRVEVTGALIVAAGLVIGGVITMGAARLGVETPGLLAARPRAGGSEGGRAWSASVMHSGADVEERPSAETPEPARLRGGRRTERGTGRTRPETRGESSRATLASRTRRLGPMDLNRASAVELEALDGVGPALSLRIVRLRDEKGGRFHLIEELLEVRGIGPATLERIRPCVTIPAQAVEGSQKNVLRKSTSAQTDSSSSHR